MSASTDLVFPGLLTALPTGRSPPLFTARRRSHWPAAVILAGHLLVGWALLQVDGVRLAVLPTDPLTVTIVSAPAAEAPSLEQLPQPVRPQRVAPHSSVLPVPAVSTLVEPPQPTKPARPDSSPTPASVVVPEPAFVAAPVPVVPAPPAPPPPPKQIPASAVQWLVPPSFDYPRVSRRLGESGTVVVRAYVDAQGGEPRQVAIERSSGHARLDDAALLAVRKARLKPQTEHGQPLEGWTRVPITFELET